MVGTKPFGLRQAAGISAILRGLDTRMGAEVRQVLDRAAAPLMTSLESGGALGTLNGQPFIQEMGRVSHNLGACIDGLFALYDLADGVGHEDAARFAQRIEEAIACNIERYVTPWGWSWYVLDLQGHRLLSSAHYHVGFLARVQVLALRTERPVFIRVAEVWRRAVDSWHIRLLSGAAKSVQAVWARHVLRLPLRDPLVLSLRLEYFTPTQRDTSAERSEARIVRRSGFPAIQANARCDASARQPAHASRPACTSGPASDPGRTVRRPHTPRPPIVADSTNHPSAPNIAPLSGGPTEAVFARGSSSATARRVRMNPQGRRCRPAVRAARTSPS